MNDSSKKILSMFALLVASLTATSASAQSSFDLRSPDKRIEIRIRTSPRLRYDVLRKGKALMEDCTLSLDVDHATLGINPKVLSAKERTNDQTLEPPSARSSPKFVIITTNSACNWMVATPLLSAPTMKVLPTASKLRFPRAQVKSTAKK